jgi:hypothetical protein
MWNSALSWVLLALLSAMLHQTKGHTSWWIVPYTAAWGALAFAYLRESTTRAAGRRGLAGLIAAFLLILIGNPGVLSFARADRAWFLQITGFMLTLFLASLRWPRLRPLVWLPLLALHLHIVRASHPVMDVLSISTEAAQALLRGINPYGRLFTDVYPGGAPYKPYYCYWPAHLLEVTAAYGVWGEIRLTSVVAALTAAGAAYALARRAGRDRADAQLRALFFALLPMTFFQVEQAWVDTPLLAALALAAWAFASDRAFWAGVWGGVAIATKQYGFVPVAFLGWEVLAHRRTQLSRFAAGLALASAVLFAPFVAVNPAAFYESTIAHFLRMPPRWDAFNWPSLLTREFPGGPPLLWVSPVLSLSIGIVCLAAVWKRRLDWLAASALSFGALFLTSKTSFSNYHYLAIGLAVLALIHRERSASAP